MGLITLAFATILLADPVRAEIALTPLRQVLTEERRTATYRLSNPSKRIVEGRVTWIDLVATETGYAPAAPETRDTLSAAPYLTVWPAFFKLEPGADVTITVAVKKDAPIPNGERRSHLLIETGAARTPLRKAGGGLELDIGLGVSTPVVLRGGVGEARARIGETKLLRDGEGRLELATTISAEGPFSAYGALVLMMTPEGGGPRRLARLDNVAAWRDAPERRFVVPIGAEILPAGLLEIRYEGSEEFEGRTFAARAFEIAPPK